MTEPKSATGYSSKATASFSANTKAAFCRGGEVGADPEALAKAIDKAFIIGDANGRKGVAQLSKSLRRILDGDAIQGLPRRDWTLIYPVMVCLDAAMTCPGMSAYINEMFERPRRRGSKTRITPLTIIDVEDYEGLLADIAVYPFDELLDSYYRAHVSVARDQIVRFRRSIFIPYLQDKPQPADIVETPLAVVSERKNSSSGSRR
jgi:hypothetical protein